MKKGKQVWMLVILLNVCLLDLPPLEARVFKMGLMAPFNFEFEFSGLTSAAAVDIAIERVKRDPLLNANGQIELTYTWRDSKCNSKTAIGNAVDLFHNESVDAFIGPPCSIACRAVAEIASFYRLPLISWVATDPDLNNKEIYSTLARTLGPFSKMGEFLLEVMKQYEWRRVVIISSNYLLFQDAAKAIKKTFSEGNITIAFQSQYERYPPDAYIRKTLIKTKMEGRIVYLVSPKEDRRRFMLMAHEMGMTRGEYVFYTIDMLPDEDNLDAANIWKGNDGRDFDARQAFECVFHVSLAALTGLAVNTLRLEIADRMRFPPWNITLPPGQKGDKYSAFLHDAVILYATALSEVYRKDQDFLDGLVVAQNMRQQFFKGTSGNVVLDKFGDREPDYTITDMNPFTGSFVKIAEVLNSKGLREFRKSILPPYWPGGEVGHKFAPPDTPVCGFMGELCKEDKVAAWIIILTAVAAAVLVTAGLILTIFLYRRNKFETELLIQSWRIMKDEVEMVNTKGGKSRDLIGSLASGVSSNDDSDGTPSTSTGKDSSQMKSLTSMGTNQQQVFSEVGYYKGILVALKTINKDHLQLTRQILLEFNEVKDLLHENLIVFAGACIDPPKLFLAWHYAEKGSLIDLLNNEDVKLDNSFKLSFMSDVAKGMDYIHKSHLHSHGALKSPNCLVDGRWTVKITDYGLTNILKGQTSDLNEYETFKRKLWTAPEILRENFPPPRGTQKGDVYSFAIVCYEIMMRTEPYCFDHMTPRDAINRIRNGESIPFRPPLPDTTELGKALLDLIRNCWSESTDHRPNFMAIRSALRKMTGGEINITENILKMMDTYSTNLEEIVDERTQQLVEEKKKTDRLLYRMLPSTVAEQLKLGKFVQPETYEQTSIYFSDIVGFTTIAADSSPMQIVDFLNDLYSCFDDIIANHDVYKVETIGDAYMVVSGVPVRNGTRHVAEIANCSLDLLSAVTHFKIRHRPHQQLQLRIGLHCGGVVAGVVGLIMPRYCLFGDTVNMAARMESSGKPLRIHISKFCHMLLRDSGGYDMTLRGDMNIKGKGLITTYWLHGRKGYDKPLPAFDKSEVMKEDMRDHKASVPTPSD